MQTVKTFKNWILLVFTVALSGCTTSSVTMIDQTTSYTSGSCSVSVYQTKAKAEQKGTIEEICVVSGSSAFSFDHTVEGAIQKNIDKLCGCGVSNAYIDSRHTVSEMGLSGVSHVTLIGFEYKKNK